VNRQLLDLAQSAGRAAADLISRRPLGRVPVAGTKSSLTDVVTEIDHASEELLKAHILGARPDDGFLGEEGSSLTGSSGVEWVVDPLDGTTNFVYGVPSYGVSIAGRVDGRVAVGYVIDVASGDEWGAIAAEGAWRLDPAIPVRLVAPEPGPMETWLVGTGFNYDSVIRAKQGAAVAKLLPQVRDIRRMGAAAVDLCALAEGRIDTFVEEGLQPWDFAAGALIAVEAGLVVRGRGEEPDSSLVVAAHPAIAGEYFTLIHDCGF
jgi:myo-inositol-1(or 4)-monophosphatase